MPKLIALAAITLVRDNERVTVKPNQLFDFTADEVKDIRKGESAEVRLLRAPVNESAEANDEDDTEGSPEGSAETKGGDDTKTATKAATKTSSRRAASADL